MQITLSSADTRGMGDDDDGNPHDGGVYRLSWHLDADGEPGESGAHLCSPALLTLRAHRRVPARKPS